MPKNKFWNFQAKDKDTGELMLYGDISSSTWWGDEVTPKDFKKDLDALGEVKKLNIYINSGGGDVFAAQAMVSMLKRHSAEKSVYIDGLAASAATFFLGVGKVIMPSNAMIMVHNPAAIVLGNANDMRKMADDLDKVRESMLAIYREKTGMTDEEIIVLLDAETWFTAEEAVEKGFADEIEQEKKLAASIDGGFLVLNNQKFDLERYKNRPQIEQNAELIEATTLGDPEPQFIQGPIQNDNGGESQPAADNLKDQKADFHRLKDKIYKKYEEEK